MAEHEHIIIDADNHFIIDPDSRSITNQTPSKKSLMQYDHNSERFTFQIPRMVENHDMSETDLVQIHYVNTGTGTSVSQRATNAGIYTVKDIQVYSEDDNLVIGSWLISDNATQNAGTLKFLVKFVCTDDEGNVTYAWHSDLFSNITITPGLNNTDDVVERDPDVIAQIYEEMESLSNMPELVEALMKEHVEPLEEQLKTLWDDFYYVPIAINSFTNTYASGYHEIGKKLTNIKFSWTLNKEAKTVKFNNEQQGTGITGSITPPNLEVTEDTTWRLEVTDERNLRKTASTSITFRNGIYYGVAPAPEEYTSEFIKSIRAPHLTDNTKVTSFTVDAGGKEDGKYVFYCLPTRLGTCSFKIGGFAGGMELIDDDFLFENASGYKEKYRIYRSDYPGIGVKEIIVT